MYANFEEALDPIITVDSDKNVEVIIDYLIPEELPKPIPENTVRFVATIQPEQHFNQLIRQYQDNYDYLLTFIPLLLSLPKARFMIALTNFCKPDMLFEKKFGVSAVFSTRNCLPGHPLRHELFMRKNEITIPRYFYTGLRSGMKGGIELSATKSAKQQVMETMFHIAIDSYDYDNSFSEKLIDPLITNTVPIYWGARNLPDFFDMNGIIYVRSVDEIIKVCNRLTEDDFHRCEPARIDNYETAFKYVPYHIALQKKIQEVLNENS